MFLQSSTVLRASVCAISCAITNSTFGGVDPFADEIILYNPGNTPSAVYNDPLTALGSPERTSGEVFGILDVVSAFSPPYGTDEIVSVSPGGELVIKFSQPVIDDPNNLYGVDLLVFGNTFFIDEAWPSGICNGFYGDGLGTIEISADGEDWHAIPNLFANSLFPTIGFTDAGAYDHAPGLLLTDFTRPVDPSLHVDHFMGSESGQIVEMYRGSGGGIGIDFESANLSEISYVRISVADDAKTHILIDAFSDVAPRLPGDVDLNGSVDVDDLLTLINGWGAVEPGDPPADFTGNSQVDVDDLLVVINHWTS